MHVRLDEVGGASYAADYNEADGSFWDVS